MLKYRLLFGILMTITLIGIILLDARLDGSISPSIPDKPVQATLLAILIALLAVPAQLEMAALVKNTGARIFRTVALPASILLATAFYWPGYADNPSRFFSTYLLFVLAAAVLAVFLVQALRFGTEGTIRNTAASLLSILYLGFLSAFLLGIRVDFGPWALLTFIFTVKSADIGAFFTGRKLGIHKMAPTISPGKTWEGLAGGVALSAIVACGFSLAFDIMNPILAIAFGAAFAVLGQMGDLAESMIKRDAAAKDASHAIPGFGGILDVIDSPLATAPIAYGFFVLFLS